MQNINNVKPQKLDQFVFPNDITEGHVRNLVRAGSTDPILLHGPYGTGKTTLARLLPVALTPEVLYEADVLERNASKDTGIEGMRKLAANCKLIPLGPQRYVILDECDGLSPEAQKSLKGLLDELTATTTFIFCTNDVHNVNEGIRSRCYKIALGPPDPSRWAGRACEIMRDHGYEVPKEVMAQGLAKQDQDIRAYLRFIQSCLVHALSISSPANDPALAAVESN